ncbi:MAG: type IV secretory system conjugative DNA transfer family protein [Oscillospiraceae bacterium]|nr:type IV secretory system conjugative DNA transfer family protein [Oscillospiraceae bacterium]
MKIRAKILIFIALLLIGLPVGLFFSWCINTILAGNTLDLNNFNIDESIEILKTDEKFRQLMLYIEILITTGISAIFLIKKRDTFESDTTEITNNIRTPTTIGQGQHGTARWLKKSEYSQTFSHYRVDVKDKPFIEPKIKKIDIKKLFLGMTPIVKIKKMYRKFSGKMSDAGKAISRKWRKTRIFKILSVVSGFFSMVYNKICTFINIENKSSGGLVVGYEKHGKTEKIYYLSDDVHSLVIGTTRSGKTRCMVIQTIAFTALSGESIIISDPKGELADYCTLYLKNLGYDVILLDFKQPLKSQRYNFLQLIIDAVNRKDFTSAGDLIQDITWSLVPKPKYSDPLWSHGEAAVISGAIAAVVCDNKDKPELQNLTNVYHFILNMCQEQFIETEPGKYESTILLNDYIANLPDEHLAKGIFGVAKIAPNRTRGSFYASALSTLQLFINQNIYSMTNTSDFILSETGNKKQAVFIILPDEKTTFYSVASMFVKQQYAALIDNADKRGGRLKNRVNFILDEFGNFTVISDFTTMLTVGGGRGIRFNLFVQSLAQIEEKYGRESAQTIADNCHCWAYLKTTDDGTASKISKRLGHYTTSSYSRSSSLSGASSNSSSSMNLISRPLLTEDEIMRIERPHTLVMYSGRFPAITRLPDLSMWQFNADLGLGDKEHNRIVRETREKEREVRKSEPIKLWGIWNDIINRKKTEFQQQMKSPEENKNQEENEKPPNLSKRQNFTNDNRSRNGDIEDIFSQCVNSEQPHD